MTDGYKRILEKIAESDDNRTMINRYLVLVSEIPEDEEKSERVLELARLHLDKNPQEAMRYAHMVYRHDTHNLQALQIVVDALKKRGRYGKAEVISNVMLKLETLIKEKKLEKEVLEEANTATIAFSNEVPSLEESPQASPKSKNNGKFALKIGSEVKSEQHGQFQISKFDVDDSDVALADGLNDDQSDSSDEDSEVSLVLGRRDRYEALEVDGKKGLPAVDVNKSGPEEAKPKKKKSKKEDKKSEKIPLVTKEKKTKYDMGLEIRDGEIFSKTELDEMDIVSSKRKRVKTLRSDEPPKPEEAVVEEEPQLQPVPESQPEPVLDVFTGMDETNIGKLAPTGTSVTNKVSESDLGVAIEMFDYYWRQGFVDEARDLLTQTAGACSTEMWWQTRNEMLRKTNIKVDIREPTVAFTEIVNANEQNVSKWPAMLERALALFESDQFQSDEDRFDVISRAVSRSLHLDIPEELVKALSTPYDSLPNEKASLIKDIHWEFVEELWRDVVDPTCTEYLETVGLHRENETFWGLYLDGIELHSARKAMVEIRRTAPEHPRLAWAKTAYARLPKIWSSLKVKGFEWCEDDGVPSFLEKLSIRCQPRMASLISEDCSPE